MSENTELHGNVYIDNSRSTAGYFGQTLIPYLVVSGPGSVTLLSSVFPVLYIDVSLAVFRCFRSFHVLLARHVGTRIPARLVNKRVNNGQSGQYCP